MTIAVFGGTGKTGRLVVAQALAAGHRVKVLARDPDKIPGAFGLEFVKGDVLDGGKVMATLTGCEAAVIALGVVKNGPTDVCSRATELVLQAATKTKTATVVAISSLGVGDSKNDIPWFFKVIVALLLKKVFADKEVQEELLQISPVQWVILRPSGLVDTPASGTAITGTGPMAEGFPPGRIPQGRVSRADVAQVALKAIADSAWHRKAWFISD